MELFGQNRVTYQNLLSYTGTDVYGDVLAPWLAECADAYRAHLAPAVDLNTAPADLEVLYGLSRISDVLLLGFCPDVAAPAERPWLTVTRADYLRTFAALGMRPVEDGRFDPFWHEIAAVRQADDPDEPLTVTEILWPGLMFGELLFARAGVAVRAGRRVAQCGVADRTPLHWTFRRRHRPAIDLSRGWGSNSQWRTDFRRDYRTGTGDHLNVDADTADPQNSIDTPWPDGPEALLTAAERQELLRHRCLLRTPAAIAELDANHDCWATDLYPFDWRLRLPHT